MNNNSISTESLENIKTLSQEFVPNKTKRIFGLTSQLQNQLIADKFAESAKAISDLTSFLKEDKVPVDENGRRIINYDYRKDWFFKNIIFVFASGAIYDQTDAEYMSRVMGCFKESHNRAYLNNTYYILKYTDELIQVIENQAKIINGNYHILMGIFNIAKPEDLKEAPMEKLTHPGLFTVATSWSQIVDIISEFVDLFGMIYESIDKVELNGFKDGKRVLRDNYYDPNPNMSTLDVLYSQTVDLPGYDQKEYFEYNRRENMRAGKVFTENQRGQRKNSQTDYRTMQKRDLYSRIEETSLQAIPNTEKGGISKMELYYMPKDNLQSEFIIYDNLDGYDAKQGINIPERVNPNEKQVIPNFSMGYNPKSANAKKILLSPSIFPK